MCGRFTLTKIDGHGLAAALRRAARTPRRPTLGRFNVCPTEQIAIVSAKEGERAMRAVRWGLVPGVGDASSASGASRSTPAARPSPTKKPFADLYARADRRCLVLADGWYEWLRSENPKQPRIPFRYTVDDGGPFAFAGLFGFAKIGEDWVDLGDDPHHARQRASARPSTTGCRSCWPGPDEEAAWLAGADDPELFAPCADARARPRAPANPAVNRAGVEGPELIEPPPPAEPRGAADAAVPGSRRTGRGRSPSTPAAAPRRLGDVRGRVEARVAIASGSLS